MVRIGIIGPESTGKSSLARYLANRYKGTYVPEYARTYVERKGTTDVTFDELCEIAHRQIEEIEQIANSQQPIAFFDTELIVTKVWFDYSFGRVPQWLEEAIKRYPMDVYLLTYPDLPWIPDKARSNGSDAIRKELFDRYEFNSLRGLVPSIEAVPTVQRDVLACQSAPKEALLAKARQDGRIAVRLSDRVMLASGNEYASLSFEEAAPVLADEKIVKCGFRLRLLKFAADHDLTDLNDPVIESGIKYRDLLLQVIQAANYAVSVAFLRRIKSAFFYRFFRSLVKSRCGVLHSLCSRRVVDHNLVFHLMIKAGIHHIDLLSAGRTGCPEQFSAPDLFSQHRIQICVDPEPDLKIMFRAAFWASDPLNLFL